MIALSSSVALFRLRFAGVDEQFPGTQRMRGMRGHGLRHRSLSGIQCDSAESLPTAGLSGSVDDDALVQQC